jgi:predicted DNA binding CopG/RHH family protein
MKDQKVIIRITDYEKKQLEQEATRRGMTKSELIRSLIARFPAPV